MESGPLIFSTASWTGASPTISVGAAFADNNNLRLTVNIQWREIVSRAQGETLGEESMRTGSTMLAKTEDQAAIERTRQELVPIKRPSRARFALAFGVAAISDFLSIWMEFAPPAQWLVDLATAGLLFLILGRRWALLPGLIVEAIPGMGVFPVWILVVMSLIVYDEIKAHKKL
jgi:hypothetical protein